MGESIGALPLYIGQVGIFDDNWSLGGEGVRRIQRKVASLRLITPRTILTDVI